MNDSQKPSEEKTKQKTTLATVEHENQGESKISDVKRTNGEDNTDKDSVKMQTDRKTKKCLIAPDSCFLCPRQNTKPPQEPKNSHHSVKEREVISLITRGNGKPVIFKIKKRQKLSKLMKAYANKVELKEEFIRFRFDGKIIENEHTPMQLEMENNDIIDISILYP